MKKRMQKLKSGTWTRVLKEWRWIADHARRYWWAIAWSVLLGILGTVLTLAASIVSKNIIDIVTGQSVGRGVETAILYVCMQLVTILLRAVAGRVSAKVHLQVRQELRATVFKKIMTAEWESLSTFHSGDLLTRSSRDTDTVAQSIISWVPSLVIHSLQFIGTFLILLWYDLPLALLALASAPITLIFSGLFAKRIRKHSERMRDIGSETSSFHTEAFRNIQFIKAFHAEDHYSDRLSDIQQKHKDAVLDHNKFTVLSSAFMSVIGLVVGGVCFLWSAYRLWTHDITFGEMTLFLQLSGSLAAAFGGLVGLVPTAITAATSAGRIMEITRLPAEKITHQEEVDRVLASRSGVTIDADNLSFTYASGQAVFRCVRFHADAGDIVAVVGPSGEGKTTLLRLMLGMMTATEGDICISGGDPVTQLTASPSTRRLFAYVPQDNALFSGTIAENLRLTNPDATDEMLTEALKTACAYDFVCALPDGIHTRLGEGGSGLSMGQMQRLSIARALLSDAPVLLLDEATSALDVQTEQQLLENIHAAHKERTCIITTHRPSVLAICGRAYRIDGDAIAPLDTEEIGQLLQE